jgi:hypothetical protein
MALNVYLTFFKSCDSSNLRALEKWYFVFCYGTPLIPALAFLLIDVTAGAGIYGPATVSWEMNMCDEFETNFNEALVLDYGQVGLDAHRLLLWSCLVRALLPRSFCMFNF